MSIFSVAPDPAQPTPAHQPEWGSDSAAGPHSVSPTSGPTAQSEGPSGRSPRGIGWVWPTVITHSGLVAGVLVLADADSLLRQVLVVWFIAICPGMAYVHLLGLKHPVVEWTLAVALSFALTSLVAMVMVYAGWWRPDLGFMVLLALTAVGIVLWLVRRAGARGTGHRRWMGTA